MANKVLYIGVSEEEHRTYKILATADGKNITQFVKAALDFYIEHLGGEDDGLGRATTEAD